MNSLKKSSEAYNNIHAAMERKQEELRNAKNKRKSPAPLIILIAVIACVIIGGGIFLNTKVTVPDSAKALSGKKYEVVVKSFKQAGFVNIKTKAVADLKVGILDKENTVDSVTIAGNSKFNKDDTFKRSASVLITYHTFSSDKK